MVHPEVKNWIKYARFEEKHGYIAHGRKVYERAVEFFGEDHIEENLFVAFAKFEETQKEVWAQQSPPVFNSQSETFLRMEVRTEENFNNCLFLRSLSVLVSSINTR